MGVAWSLSEARGSTQRLHPVEPERRTTDVGTRRLAGRSVAASVWRPSAASARADAIFHRCSPSRSRGWIGDRVQITDERARSVVDQPRPQGGGAKIFLDFLRRGATQEQPVGLVGRI